jgi:hypothetical protein
MVKCGNCRFWVKSEKELGRGECRYNPPSVLLVPQQTLAGTTIGFAAIFPTLNDDQECGKGTILLRVAVST